MQEDEDIAMILPDNSPWLGPLLQRTTLSWAFTPEKNHSVTEPSETRTVLKLQTFPGYLG